MTTYNHTAIPASSAANTSVVNAPLAQLDAAMGNVATLALDGASIVSGIGTAAPTTTAQTLVGAINEAHGEIRTARNGYTTLYERLDALVLAGGNIATLTNGAASAGQNVVDVDSTTGFVAGAYVAYTLVGGAIEYNTIDAVTSSTRLTMDTNVGTGGIANDTYISMISPSEVAAANAINHAGNLTLAQAMAYAAGNVYNARAYGASPSASAATNVAAIQAAIDDAELTAGLAIIDPGSYNIDGQITLDASSTVLAGSGGNLHTTLVCTAAGAGVTIGKADAITYNAGLMNIVINGNSIATTGLTLINFNEGVIRDVLVNGATTGVTISGLVTGNPGSGLSLFENLRVANATTGIAITEGASAPWFQHCNFYALTTAIALTGTINKLIIRDSWFETFTTGLLLDSTSATVAVYSLQIANNYFLSTSGGGTYTARIVKAVAGAGFKNDVKGLDFTGNHIYTTAAKYAIEVAWSGNYFGGENAFHGRVRDNFLHATTNMDSLIASDVTDVSKSWVWLQTSGNAGPASQDDGTVEAVAVAVEEKSGPIYQSKISLAISGANDIDLADGDHGAGKKIFTFPAGRILVLGATIDALATSNDAFEANPNDIYYLGVGTVTAADDATLATTEQDIIPVTTIDTAGNTSLINTWKNALAASAQFDGTTTAVALFVNAAVAGTSLTKALTIAVVGTLTVTWINLGDY